MRMKEFFEKVILKKRHEKLPKMQRVNMSIPIVPEVIKLYMLNSAEYEISTAHKN